VFKSFPSDQLVPLYSSERAPKGLPAATRPAVCEPIPDPAPLPVFKLFPSVQLVPLYSSDSFLLSGCPPATKPAVCVPIPIDDSFATFKAPPLAHAPTLRTVLKTPAVELYQTWPSASTLVGSVLSCLICFPNISLYVVIIF